MYDLSSTLVYGDKTMALNLNGKHNNLRRRDWEALAFAIGLPPRARDSAITVALNAASGVDWDHLPFKGSPLNGVRRELRLRRAELEG